MNAVLLVLLAVATVWIQCLIGGTRLVFSLPPYLLLSAASLLTLVVIRKNPTSPRVSCLAAATLLGGYVAIRAAWSPTDYLWWPDFTMVLACLIAYFLVALYLDLPALRMVLVLAFFALTVGELIPAFRQFSQGDNFMAFGFLRPNSGERASGFFISPNSLAGFLETIGIIAFSLACWMRWKGWVKGLTGLFACLCWVGVAVSGSRGGYLSTVFSWLVFAGISLWVIRRLNPDRFGFAVTLTIIGFVVMLAGAGLLMTESSVLRGRLARLGDQFSGVPSDARIYNWQAAEDQFRLAPVFGTGAGTHLYYGRLFRRRPIQVDPVHAHNDYLELAAEYGLVGAGLMAMFLATHIFSGMRSISAIIGAEEEYRYRPRSNALALQIGCLAALAAYLVHSYVDFNLHIPGNALLFGCLFGMLANPGPDGLEHSPLAAVAPPPLAMWFRVILPALGVTMIAFGWPKLRGENLAEKARIAVRNGAFQEGLELATKAAAAEPRNPYVYFTLGEANRGLAMAAPQRVAKRPYFEAAAAAYREGLKIFPQDEDLLTRLGQALDGMGDYRTAAQAYLDAIATDPNLGVLHYLYALHLQRVGRAEEAEEELDRAGNLANKNFDKLPDFALPPPTPSGQTQNQ